MDSGWDSYYISKDAGGKLTFNPMWDYELALGNFIDVKGMDAEMRRRNMLIPMNEISPSGTRSARKYSPNLTRLHHSAHTRLMQNI